MNLYSTMFQSYLRIFLTNQPSVKTAFEKNNCDNQKLILY